MHDPPARLLMQPEEHSTFCPSVPFLPGRPEAPWRKKGEGTLVSPDRHPLEEQEGRVPCPPGPTCGLPSAHQLQILPVQKESEAVSSGLQHHRPPHLWGPVLPSAKREARRTPEQGHYSTKPYGAPSRNRRLAEDAVGSWGRGSSRRWVESGYSELESHLLSFEARNTLRSEGKESSIMGGSVCVTQQATRGGSGHQPREERQDGLRIDAGFGDNTQNTEVLHFLELGLGRRAGPEIS